MLVGGFLSVAVFAKAAQWLSIRFGRVQTALLCLNTGLLFLVAMAALDDWIYCRGLSSSGLVIPIFIVSVSRMLPAYSKLGLGTCLTYPHVYVHRLARHS